jgi:1-deoxyxylulose-5-phosphate synthase
VPSSRSRSFGARWNRELISSAPPTFTQQVSEEITGRWLCELVPRSEVIIATKVGFAGGDSAEQYGLSRKNILAQIDASLTRLRTDYVDLSQIHRFDYQTSIDRTLAAPDEVVRLGKARYAGVCSMFTWQLARM